MRIIRDELADGVSRAASFYFQTADIVSQVLNFGLSAPIDIQIQDRQFQRAPTRPARSCCRPMQKIPGVVDAHITAGARFSRRLQIDVDRQRAAKLGVSQRDVANNLLTSLSSSSLVAPTYFLNPQNGVNYIVAVPDAVEQGHERVRSSCDLPATPAAATDPRQRRRRSTPRDHAECAGDAPCRISPACARASSMNSINHYTIQRVIDVAANVDGRDLGGVAGEIKAASPTCRRTCRSTSNIDLRGQNEVMETSFRSLGLGLILAIFLVYALLVVLFQSWVDPFIIMMAVPGRADRHHLDAGADRTRRSTSNR